MSFRIHFLDLITLAWILPPLGLTFFSWSLSWYMFDFLNYEDSWVLEIKVEFWLPNKPDSFISFNS